MNAVPKSLIEQHAQPLYGGGPMAISHLVAPCVLHTAHRPVTIINELHHIRPQYLQRRVWGEVRDDERWALCGTGHSTVHYAVSLVLDQHQAIPRWCVDKTRDLVEWTLDWFETERLKQA